jgi:hypothetical protein
VQKKKSQPSPELADEQTWTNIEPEDRIATLVHEVCILRSLHVIFCGQNGGRRQTFFAAKTVGGDKQSLPKTSKKKAKKFH